MLNSIIAQGNHKTGSVLVSGALLYSLALIARLLLIN